MRRLVSTLCGSSPALGAGADPRRDGDRRSDRPAESAESIRGFLARRRRARARRRDHRPPARGGRRRSDSVETEDKAGPGDPGAGPGEYEVVRRHRDGCPDEMAGGRRRHDHDGTVNPPAHRAVLFRGGEPGGDGDGEGGAEGRERRPKEAPTPRRPARAGSSRRGAAVRPDPRARGGRAVPDLRYDRADQLRPRRAGDVRRAPHLVAQQRREPAVPPDCGGCSSSWRLRSLVLGRVRLGQRRLALETAAPARHRPDRRDDRLDRPRHLPALLLPVHLQRRHRQYPDYQTSEGASTSGRSTWPPATTGRWASGGRRARRCVSSRCSDPDRQGDPGGRPTTRRSPPPPASTSTGSIRVVWIAGAALAGLAGVLLGLSAGHRLPDRASRSCCSIFAAVTLGGLGTAYGALVGASSSACSSRCRPCGSRPS